MVHLRKCAPGESPGGGGSEAGAAAVSARPGRFLWLLSCSNTRKYHYPRRRFRYKANLFLTLLRESASLPTNLQVPVAARAYLSCPGKKGSKEAGGGGFELCAPAHKSHLPKTPPGAHFRWCTIVFRSTLGSTIKATAPILRR